MNNVAAIIDDGITIKNSERVLEFNLKILNNYSFIDTAQQSSIGKHGSICLSIMKSLYPLMKIGSINIFDNSIYTDIIKLKVALEWCFLHQIKLIHLSIGSIDMSDYLVVEPIVKKLIRHNTIIVAAMDNGNQYTIPACFGGVIGVSHICHRDYFFGVSNLLNHPKVYSTTLVNWIPKYQSQSSNSFAAPMVTAAVAKYIDHNGENCKVKQVLRHLNHEFETSGLVCFRPDFLETPIVLRLNTANRLPGEFIYKEIYISSHNLPLHLSETIIILEECLNDRENLYSFLNANKDKIMGIIYTGIRDTSLHQLIESEIMCLYYDESSMSSFLNDAKIHDGIDSDIPVILLLVNQINYKDGINVGINLQQYFHEQGYAMQLISTFKYSYLYGCDYCQNYLQVIKLLSDEYQIGQYDLRIIITDSDVIAQEGYIDVCIRLGDVVGGSSMNVYMLPLPCDDPCISHLEEYLLKCLV